MREEKTYSNASEMDSEIKKYLQNYNPAGYCTTVKIEVDFDYERFMQSSEIRYVVTFDRLESCE